MVTLLRERTASVNQFSAGNLNPRSDGGTSGTGHAGQRSLSARLGPLCHPSQAQSAHVLEHLKGDAVVEEQPSLAWPVSTGSIRLGVARAPHCLLHGARRCLVCSAFCISYSCRQVTTTHASSL